MNDAPAGGKRTLARNVTVWPVLTVVGDALARIDSSEPPSTVISSAVPGALTTFSDVPPLERAGLTKRVFEPSSVTIAGPSGNGGLLISGPVIVITLPSAPTIWTYFTAAGLKPASESSPLIDTPRSEICVPGSLGRSRSVYVPPASVAPAICDPEMNFVGLLASLRMTTPGPACALAAPPASSTARLSAAAAAARRAAHRRAVHREFTP